MNFPSQLDFLETLGVEPVEVDLDWAYCEYCLYMDEKFQLNFGFSGVSNTFLVVLKYENNEIVRLNSENLETIKFQKTEKGKGLQLKFKSNETDSIVEITVDPFPHCSWWSLVK